MTGPLGYLESRENRLPPPLGTHGCVVDGMCPPPFFLSPARPFVQVGTVSGEESEHGHCPLHPQEPALPLLSNRNATASARPPMRPREHACGYGKSVCAQRGPLPPRHRGGQCLSHRISLQLVRRPTANERSPHCESLSDPHRHGGRYRRKECPSARPRYTRVSAGSAKNGDAAPPRGGGRAAVIYRS